MRRAILVAVLALVAFSAAWIGTGWAQEGGVGGLRVVDDSGEPLGTEPAPPGEKLFRLPSGADRFNIAFDYEGSGPTDVQVRVMGPSGTILFQETVSPDTSGVQQVTFDAEGTPLDDHEYVINAYIGPEAYLADSLQLIVGDAPLSGGANEAEVLTGEQLAPEAGATLVPQAPGGDEGVDVASIPGGPSWQVLALAGVGIIALLAIVLWAAWSAVSRR